MATICVRDVPESVAEALKKRAAAEGKSVSAYVGEQLAVLAARPTNAEIVARLRSLDRSSGASREQILDELHAGRR